jgi:hypothetical protein
MDLLLHIRVAAVVLLLSLVVQGQKYLAPWSKATNRGPSTQSASQEKPPNSHPQSSPIPVPSSTVKKEIPSQNRELGRPPDSAATAPQDTFSQLTLFLFASGVAFFIALLAWSDQIRGIDQDVKELERRFLEDTGIEKRTFLRIVKPKSPDDRGLALLEVVSGGRIKNRDSAEVLQVFTKWNKQWSWIERLSAGKYYVTIGLTIVLLVVGFASLFTDPSQQVKILWNPCRVEMLLLIPPATLVALLLVIIICIAVRENALRSFLKSVSDMV